MLKTTVLAAAVCVAACLISPAAAQTPLFSENSEIEIQIEGDVSALVRRAARNTDPIPATLTVTGQPQRWEIGLEPRGISRRTGGICAFPPLRIDFGEGTSGTLFRGQNRLKVVTRCRSGSSFEQINVLEYTAYRLYNELSSTSYRVRPARITYADLEETQWNFLIEDVDDMARRNDLVALDVPTGEVRAENLNAEAAARYALFQFMIGNLDWDMVQGRVGEDCCHNSRLIAANAQTRSNLIPAPYDFDYSGFVNAPYAIPPEGINVRNVRQRYYRGYCRFNDELPGAIAHFQSRRDALLAVIDGETRLSASRRQSARRYIEDFFELIGDASEVDRQLVRRCR